MQQKFGTCKECDKDRPLNSKLVCSECQFTLNHDGKSRQEVYLERKLEREKGKLKEIHVLKRKSLKASKKRPKTRVNRQLRNERLEKRREQIRLDEAPYEEVFNSKSPFCEETGQPLNTEFRDEEGDIIARWQYSHILTKKAYPEFRNNPKNFNRLSYEAHQQWEFGDREKMKIYNKNQEIIQELLKKRNNGII